MLNSLFGQTGVEFFDIMFTRDNPYTMAEGRVYKNIQLNYEKMRQLALTGGYEKAWIVESDTIPPRDALQKLLEVEAPVVSGLYALRHGEPTPNIRWKDNHWGWPSVQAHWGQTIETDGGCTGCLLIDRSVLEKFSFINNLNNPPDGAFMDWCINHKIKQMARLDVVCGHKKPDGEVIWPDLEHQYIIKAA